MNGINKLKYSICMAQQNNCKYALIVYFIAHKFIKILRYHVHLKNIFSNLKDNDSDLRILVSTFFVRGKITN